MDTKTCPQCGEINPAHHAYCVCGASLIKNEIKRNNPFTTAIRRLLTPLWIENWKVTRAIQLRLLLKELKDLPLEEKNQTRLLVIIREIGNLRDHHAIEPLTEFGIGVMKLVDVATKTINEVTIPQDTMNRAYARIKENQLGPQELVVLTYTSALSIKERLWVLQGAVMSALEEIRGNGK